MLGCAAGGGLWFWRNAVVSKHTEASNAAILSGVAAGDFAAARSALAGFADTTVRETREREIRLAEVKHGIEVRDTSLLRLAIGKEGDSWIDPKLLESANLELARDAVQRRDFDGYQEILSKRPVEAARSGQWILLEADVLLAKGLVDEARRFLKEAKLSGPEDALRHARLALLDANAPWKAMLSIDKGLKANPQSADLLSFRAQIEEAAGRQADARLDYVAAVLSDRKNPLHRDVLANFYLRVNDLSAAAETWREAAADTGLGVYALKAWFWSRMAGVPLTAPLPVSRQKGWHDLTAALADSPRDVFWCAALDTAANGTHGVDRRPEVVWMRILESLRSGSADAAGSGLSTLPREAERIRPGLATRLMVQLGARSGKDPRLALAGRDLPAEEADAHPFLTTFSRWATRTATADESRGFESWIASAPAASGILLASGWPGAALTLGGGNKASFTDKLPEWFDYGYAKSLLGRDGKEASRVWLASLTARSTAAELLYGEILLTTPGSLDAGLAVLRGISAGNSALADRATWTLALTELDRGNAAEARRVTTADTTFAPSVQGREILARCALADGNRAETLRIYQELGGSSTDAMIYLSKEAFAAKDFKQAREWTAQLARTFPERPEFRKNLLKIDEADKAARP
jgi:tetratricopeptide (TPR) repeat protein